MGVTDDRITLDQLRLGAISNGNNIYNLIKQNKAKIIDGIVAKNKDEIKFKILIKKPIELIIESGTLLLPADEKKS